MVYNAWHNVNQTEGSIFMPEKVAIHETESIGDRIARLRTKNGYTQRDLARETGISHRMIAHYEKQSKSPPAHVLTILAQALHVSVDQLLGLEKLSAEGKKNEGRDTRLWRRFSQIEKLPSQEKRRIIQVLDAFIEKEQFKKIATSK
jgi:transcriptional regulator with XRE-family HTH domain